MTWRVSGYTVADVLADLRAKHLALSQCIAAFEALEWLDVEEKPPHDAAVPNCRCPICWGLGA